MRGARAARVFKASSLGAVRITKAEKKVFHNFSFFSTFIITRILTGGVTG